MLTIAGLRQMPCGCGSQAAHQHQDPTAKFAAEVGLELDRQSDTGQWVEIVGQPQVNVGETLRAVATGVADLGSVTFTISSPAGIVTTAEVRAELDERAVYQFGAPRDELGIYQLTIEAKRSTIPLFGVLFSPFLGIQTLSRTFQVTEKRVAAPQDAPAPDTSFSPLVRPITGAVEDIGRGLGKGFGDIGKGLLPIALVVGAILILPSVLGKGK